MIYHADNDGKSYTAVAVTASPGSLLEQFGFVGEGEARCRPDDAFSEETGILIALGRAIQDYGRQVTEAGDAKVITKADLDKALDYIGERVGSEDFVVVAEEDFGPELFEDESCIDCGQDLESPSCDPEPTAAEVEQDRLDQIFGDMLLGLLIQQEGSDVTRSGA